jgi:hypothetical protein
MTTENLLQKGFPLNTRFGIKIAKKRMVVWFIMKKTEFKR